MIWGKKKKNGGKKAAQLWEECISPGNIQGTVIWNESQRLKMYCRLVDVCWGSMWRAHAALTLAPTGSDVSLWLYDSSHTAAHDGNTLQSALRARGREMPNQMSVIVCNYFKSVGKSMCAHYEMHRVCQMKERFLLFCFYSVNMDRMWTYQIFLKSVST